MDWKDRLDPLDRLDQLERLERPDSKDSEDRKDPLGGPAGQPASTARRLTMTSSAVLMMSTGGNGVASFFPLSGAMELAQQGANDELPLGASGHHMAQFVPYDVTLDEFQGQLVVRNPASATVQATVVMFVELAMPENTYEAMTLCTTTIVPQPGPKTYLCNASPARQLRKGQKLFFQVRVSGASLVMHGAFTMEMTETELI
jgi:hypothetical protein